MNTNFIKGLLVALALCVAPAAMASTLPAYDGVLNVGIGGPSQFFHGEVEADEAFDYWQINLSGSQGTTTAASAIFGGAASMDLFHWNAGDTLGALIASAVEATLPPELGGGDGYVLSAFLAAGTYILRIGATSGANSYAGHISAVPLPGAALLFGSALFGAGLIGRKKLGARRAEAVAV